MNSENDNEQRAIRIQLRVSDEAVRNYIAPKQRDGDVL